MSYINKVAQRLAAISAVYRAADEQPRSQRNVRYH